MNNTRISPGIVMAPVILSVAGFLACSTIPRDAEAVRNFDQRRYLGKWYEVARLDFTFERNLNNTTAEYSLRDDGKIRVPTRIYPDDTRVSRILLNWMRTHTLMPAYSPSGANEVSPGCPCLQKQP